MVQTAAPASHEKAPEHRVFVQWHQELKLIAFLSAFSTGQHHLGHLLVKILFAMHDPQTEQVTVEGHRCVQIGDCDTNMIKTEQTWQHILEIGGHSGHGHQGARLVMDRAPDVTELRAWTTAADSKRDARAALKVVSARLRT
jgi:hypothetical protein